MFELSFPPLFKDPPNTIKEVFKSVQRCAITRLMVQQSLFILLTQRFTQAKDRIVDDPTASIE